MWVLWVGLKHVNDYIYKCDIKAIYFIISYTVSTWKLANTCCNIIAALIFYNKQ